MTATELKLNKFLSQNDMYFVIPVDQRNYDWSKNKCLTKAICMRVSAGNYELTNWLCTV